MEELRPYTVKQSWHKASDQDLNIYKNQLDELLGKVTLDEDLLFCRDIHCVDHRDMICDLYNTVILSCIKASKHIPTTSKPSIKVKPGWNDNVQKQKMWLCHIIVYRNLMVVQEKDILLKCVE